jgi:uncharacterized damage-inducible protein DinB
MTEPTRPAWLSGPIPGIDRTLMPAAHSLAEARLDLERAAREATPDELWQRPGGAASAGFHLRHMAGSLDRLMTYARGEPLTEAQRSALAAETTTGATADELIATALLTIDRAMDQLRATPGDSVFDARSVGRAALPATVIGLLFHAAEHTTRHTGQLITTLKVVRGPR